MLFIHRFWGESQASSSATSTELSFAPDVLRPPTHFRGKLRQRVPFREAISALHAVVVSDLRFKAADKMAYKEWAAAQEELELGRLTAHDDKLRGKVTALETEVREIRALSKSVMGPFFKAREQFFKYAWEKQRDVWFVLDPVVTVQPDRIFFEGFSLDESSYGCLSCSYEVFHELGERACGTINVDYSLKLYNEFQKIRDYKDTLLQVDPGGFAVQTAADDEHREVKIDLPESWVRGFLQVSSAMTLPAYRFELQPIDLYNLCLTLRRRRERQGPRSLRFVLKNGAPIRIVAEPWNLEIVCRRSIYHGPDAEIRVWGRRRLFLLERLVAVARQVTVHLLGSGLPAFFVADLGDMAFTLGLSGWTANDWSRLGQFDLLAPRADVDVLTRDMVFNALRHELLVDADTLAKKLGLERKIVLSALASGAQSGQVLYDLDCGLYRLRELSRQPLPLDLLRFANPREQAAAGLTSGLAPKVAVVVDGKRRIEGKVKDADKTFEAFLVLDRDERLVEARCTCSFFVRNRLHQGPCEHILALRIAARRQAGAHS